MNEMFESHNNEKEKVNTNIDNKPKKLQLNNQNKKEAGFAQTQSMYLIVLIVLFVLFALLVKFLVW